MTRATVKRLLPPILLDGLRAVRDWYRPSEQISERWFREWWQLHGMYKALDVEFVGMVNGFLASPSAKMMSNYWWYLCKKNLEQLHTHGYDTFKQTVARHYFTWVGEDAKVLAKDLQPTRAFTVSVDAREFFRHHACWSQEDSWRYNLNTILLYLKVAQATGFVFNAILDEPEEGSPPSIQIAGKMISQDTLFSYLDYQSISQVCDLTTAKCVLEIGAGYGRTAYYLLKKHPQLSYIIVDVPPALYVAKRYLTSLFPDRDLQFLLPDQMPTDAHPKIDLVLAIDNLREMHPKQVEAYFAAINEIADAFYFTYWPQMPIPFDTARGIEDAPYPHIDHLMEDMGYFFFKHWPHQPNWERIYGERAMIPSCYVNVAYKIRRDGWNENYSKSWRA